MLIYKSLTEFNQMLQIHFMRCFIQTNCIWLLVFIWFAQLSNVSLFWPTLCLYCIHWDMTKYPLYNLSKKVSIPTFFLVCHLCYELEKNNFFFQFDVLPWVTRPILSRFKRFICIDMSHPSWRLPFMQQMFVDQT